MKKIVKTTATWTSWVSGAFAVAELWFLGLSLFFAGLEILLKIIGGWGQGKLAPYFFKVANSLPDSFRDLTVAEFGQYFIGSGSGGYWDLFIGLLCILGNLVALFIAALMVFIIYFLIVGGGLERAKKKASSTGRFCSELFAYGAFVVVIAGIQMLFIVGSGGNGAMAEIGIDSLVWRTFSISMFVVTRLVPTILFINVLSGDNTRPLMNAPKKLASIAISLFQAYFSYHSFVALQTEWIYFFWFFYSCVLVVQAVVVFFYLFASQPLQSFTQPNNRDESIHQN